MIKQVINYDHIHIVSPDARSLAEWYVEKLDGEIEKEYEMQGALQIFVRTAGKYLIIRGQRTGETIAPRQSLQWGIDHFGFTVDGDFNAYCEQLKGKGVKFILDPMDFNATSRIAYIEDYDGIKIELLQRS